MPTKKPIIQALVDENIFSKFKYITEKERRSNAQMAAIMIEKYIEKYETEHGAIVIDTDTVSHN